MTSGLARVGSGGVGIRATDDQANAGKAGMAQCGEGVPGECVLSIYMTGELRRAGERV